MTLLIHLQRYPVIPVSHVWTNQSSIYIGFSGGQIMLVDVESSSMKMLVNQVEVREIIPFNETVHSIIHCFHVGSC